MDQVVECPAGSTIANVRTCLTYGMRIGLAFAVQSAVISLVATIAIFLLILRNVLRLIRHPNPGPWSLIRQPADVYMLTIFVFDIMYSVGGILNIKWIQQGSVQIGGFCNAQGIIQQIGETGVAMTTLALAVHTFLTVWSRKGLNSRTVSIVIVFLILVYVVLYAFIGGAIHNDYFAPTPYWCWISQPYSAQRITGEYLWFWLALFISIILYVPLFLWNRGNIDVHEKYWWRMRMQWKPRPANPNDPYVRTRPGAPSLAILAYPLVYAAVVLPISAVRWYTFQGHTATAETTFAVEFIFRLGGALNVLLLLTTRPNLLLFGYWPMGNSEGEMSEAQRGLPHGQLNASMESGDGWRMPETADDGMP